MFGAVPRCKAATPAEKRPALARGDNAGVPSRQLTLPLSHDLFVQHWVLAPNSAEVAVDSPDVNC